MIVNFPLDLFRLFQDRFFRTNGYIAMIGAFFFLNGLKNRFCSLSYGYFAFLYHATQGHGRIFHMVFLLLVKCFRNHEGAVFLFRCIL